jgi:hypothetical protein
MIARNPDASRNRRPEVKVELRVVTARDPTMQVAAAIPAQTAAKSAG